MANTPDREWIRTFKAALQGVVEIGSANLGREDTLLYAVLLLGNYLRLTSGRDAARVTLQSSSELIADPLNDLDVHWE